MNRLIVTFLVVLMYLSNFTALILTSVYGSTPKLSYGKYLIAVLLLPLVIELIRRNKLLRFFCDQYLVIAILTTLLVIVTFPFSILNIGNALQNIQFLQHEVGLQQTSSPHRANSNHPQWQFFRFVGHK